MHALVLLLARICVQASVLMYIVCVWCCASIINFLILKWPLFRSLHLHAIASVPLSEINSLSSFSKKIATIPYFGYIDYGVGVCVWSLLLVNLG